ncbi:MAG: hypothetical protein ACXACX_07545 [Candidatus Hodarchaeales archaeon]
MLKKHILGISFIIAFLVPLSIGMGSLTLNTSQDISSSISLDEKNTIRANLNHGTPFNIADFGENHNINLTRSISVNDWGVVILADTLNVSVPSESESKFSSFEIYFSEDFVNNVHFQQIYVQNSSTAIKASIEEMKPEVVNGIGTFHFNFNASTSNVTLSVTFSISDSVSKNKELLGNLADSIYPYKFSGENLFYPWYSIPITNYDLFYNAAGKIGRRALLNNTVIPNTETVGGDFEAVFEEAQTQPIGTHYTLNEIQSINRDALSSYEYNLGSLGTKKFIPAFDTSFEENMTQNVAFDVFFEASLVEFTKVDSTIIIDTWGSTTHIEEITLKNGGVSDAQIPGPREAGTTTVGAIPVVLYLPVQLENLFGVRARDSLGNLSNTNTIYRSDEPGYAQNLTAIRVVPRLTISPGEEYKFSLTYQITNKRSLNEKEGFLTPAFDLSTPLMTMFNWTVRELNLKIIFPIGASMNFNENNNRSWLPNSVETVSSPSLFGLELIGLGRPTLSLTFEDVSYLRNVEILIHFSMPPIIGWFFEPFLFMVFFLIIGIVLVAVRATSYRLTPVVGSIKEKEDVPFDLVEGFVRFYQEKTAIRQRMNDLDSKRGRLKKGDYDKQKQTLESKATNTDRDLMKYTQTLSDKGGRYREAVRQIEIAEATRDDILRNITDLNKKKRQKRIRSEIHARLLDDYTKKLKRANTTIERVLVDLRSLLTEKS